MNVLFAILLVGASSIGVEYRVVDTGTAFRPLDRRSLLYGSVEFRVRAPEGTEARSLRVFGSAAASAGAPPLCESREVGSPCVIVFPDIARRELRVEYELIAPGRGPRRIDSSIATLHAHAGLEAYAGGNVVVEHARTVDIPSDHVTRTIRLESSDGRGSRKRVRYHTDIRAEDLDVRVRGVRGSRVMSLSPPNPDAAKLIPILFDVAPYVGTKTRRGGAVWKDPYAVRVAELRQGLKKAAENGVDVEYVVVSYGADSRLFGPFRLHPGPLADADRAADESTLDALERVLRRPPEASSPAADFGSVVQTLNDLYLRGHPGVVQLVWITDGWSSGRAPRFQPDLWPQRIAELNAEWSEDEQARILTALDMGLGFQAAALARFTASMPPEASDRTGRIVRFLQTLDPDATRTLHPHRVETSPMMNCMFVPSERSLRSDRFAAFREFVEGGWGGDLVRLLRLNRSKVEDVEEELNRRRKGPGAETFAGLLQRTAEQMAHSGRIELEVPNPDQNGARREIAVHVRRDGVRARLMPTYTASRPRNERLVDFLASPFKTLRMLAAYEVRHHPFDRALREASKRRWEVESDPQVRAVVFESWISIQLQLLQSDERRPDIHDSLTSIGREAERLPLPALAREAATAAEWYRSRMAP